MAENNKLREIVRCGVELLDVKDELFELQSVERTEMQQVRAEQLEQRKRQLLHRVSSL
jgi:hypothetical protein